MLPGLESEQISGLRSVAPPAQQGCTPDLNHTTGQRLSDTELRAADRGTEHDGHLRDKAETKEKGTINKSTILQRNVLEQHL